MFMVLGRNRKTQCKSVVQTIFNKADSSDLVPPSGAANLSIKYRAEQCCFGKCASILTLPSATQGGRAVSGRFCLPNSLQSVFNSVHGPGYYFAYIVNNAVEVKMDITSCK